MRTVTTLPVTEKTVGQEYNDATHLGNWDSLRDPIDRVIIHTMVGFAQGADERFNDPASNVSAHYGVLETGEIWHWVDENKTAYHAGDLAMNRRSIGIEHEDNGLPNDPRPDALYTTSANLVREICQYYGIPIDRQHILKHSEVIATQCPDGLDIDRIVREAAAPAVTCDPNWRTERDDNWNMSQASIELLSVQVPSNPTSADKVRIGQDMANAIQGLIDYKNSHPAVVQPGQPNSNSSTPDSQVPGTENAPIPPSNQSNSPTLPVDQTVSPNIGQLIIWYEKKVNDFFVWLFHRNEVSK